MEKFYTKEFILAFLYNEIPFAHKRQFVLRLQKDPLLRRMFYELKATVESMKQLKAIAAPEKLVSYVKAYAAQSIDHKNLLIVRNN